MKNFVVAVDKVPNVNELAKVFITSGFKIVIGEETSSPSG